MRHLPPAHVAQKTLHLDAHDRSLSGLRPIQSSPCLGIILLFLLSGLNDYLCKESQRKRTESSVFCTTAYIFVAEIRISPGWKWGMPRP
jgi:hypothetical protein